MFSNLASRLEIIADDDICGGRVAQVRARFLYLAANLLDGYGLRRSLAEFIHPPYGA